MLTLVAQEITQVAKEVAGEDMQNNIVLCNGQKE
jgi:hypothetical protein